METTRFRLIASDLDGTLVQSGSNTPSPAVLQTFHRLNQSGIHFTIATGRSWKETQPIAEALQVHIPVIVESGALVLNPCTGAVLATQSLTKDVVASLDLIPLAAGIDCFRLSEQGIFYYERAQSLCGNWLLGKQECRLAMQADPDSIWLKYLFIGTPELLVSLAQQLRVQFGPAVNTILWPPEPNGESFMEVFDGSASKGRALQRLAQDLNVPMAEVLAFGDSYNDFDLLEVAGLGIAIEGAPQTLLDLADRVIPGPDAEGIVRFLSGEFETAQKKAI